MQSIVDQTYTNLEIVLVDDGSPDNCPAMCDAWAERDSRIQVIHKENGGLSDARNAGMAAATGDYIAFVDSDDWVEQRFLECLWSVLKERNCDAVGCAYRRVAEGKEPPEAPKEFAVSAYTRGEAMAALIDNTVQQVVWNKLYPRTLMEDIPFEKGKHHEDEFWSYQVFSRFERYAQIDYVGYNYLQRDASIMGEGYSLKRLDAVEAKERRQAFLEAEMPSLASRGRINLFFSCLYHGQQAVKYLRGNEKRQAVARLEKTVARWPLTREDRKSLRFTHRLWAELAGGSFVMTCQIRNGFRIGS